MRCSRRRHAHPVETTLTTFETIDSAALTDVQGGCGKKQCKCPPPAPPPQPQPQSSGTSIDVSVSYGLPQATGASAGVSASAGLTGGV